MKRVIKAAEAEDKESIFKDRLDQIEDDFSYLMEGLNHINMEDASIIADSINESIQSCIAKVADAISE